MAITGLEVPVWFYPALVWTLVWKGISMWRAARLGQLPWFIIILVVNTVGILPIIYLVWFQRSDVVDKGSLDKTLSKGKVTRKKKAMKKKKKKK